MKKMFDGRLAAVALCASLSACGGDGGSNPPAPTVLPASVAITSDARVEAGNAGHFGTDLAVTQGVTFRWDFGDGTTAAGASVDHTYAKPGSYQVTLALSNEAEDLRTATSTVQVGAYANVKGLDCTQGDAAGWCWQHVLATGQQINSVFFVDASHAWAVGDNLTILKSSDGGASWTRVALDPQFNPDSLTNVRFYDAQHGMALTSTGKALQTSDGGATWAFNGLIGSYGGASSFVDYSASRIIVQSYYYGSGAMSTDGGATWSNVGMYGTVQATSTDCWSFDNSSIREAAGCGATSQVSLVASATNGYQYFTGLGFWSATQGLAVGYGYSWDTSSSTTTAWSTNDGGATWTPFAATGFPASYYSAQSMQMLDSQTAVFYGPYDQAAWISRDGGHNWAQIVSSTALGQNWSYYRATGFANGNVMWQAGANVLSISTDLGQTWHDATVHAEDAIQQFNQSSALSLVQYTDASNFVVGVSHRFYVTHDGGQSFTRILGPDTRDTASASAVGEFTDFRHGRFLTSNGALLTTADGGRTWTRQDYTSHASAAVALHFTSATEGWLILEGKLAHTADGGATWATPLVSATMSGLQGMSWGDATHGWTWSFAGVFATADGGANWTAAAPLPNGLGVGGAMLTGPLAGVAVTPWNGAFTTKDGGASWQAAPVPVSPLGGTLVRAGGQTVWSLTSPLARSKDGGVTWQPAGPSNLNGSPTGMAFADAQHGWLITSAGSVLHTIDGGDSWTAQPVGTNVPLQGIVAADAMTAWIITRDGQILATASAGN